MSSPGDRLLFALSFWREASLLSFRAAFDALCGSRVESESSARYRRLEGLRTLQALGHCEYSTSDRRLFVAPATLVVLPIPGVSQALLCGARSPGMLGEIRAFDAGERGTVTVEASGQRARSAAAPTRIVLKAEDSEPIRVLSDELGMGFARLPPAWSLLELAPSLQDYVGDLRWRREPDLDWPRGDFSPQSLRFGEPCKQNVGLRLSRFEHPGTGRVRYYLRREERHAPVDPSWARFAVLNEVGRNVLAYDQAACSLCLPLYLPLPPLMERALCLCSGLAAQKVTVERHSRTGIPEMGRAYAGVPIDVAEAVASLLGQQVVLA